MCRADARSVSSWHRWDDEPWGSGQPRGRRVVESSGFDHGHVVFPMARPQHRSMVNFYELFDKEKRLEGRKRLQAEMRKGHFDDFRRLRDTRGKLWQAAAVRRDEPLADVFRGVEVNEVNAVNAVNEVGDRGGVDGGKVERTVELRSVAAGTVRLLGVAVRDGAQPMLDAWIDAWERGCVDLSAEGDERTETSVLELSVVDSFVMRLAPFRWMLYAKSNGGGRRSRKIFMFTNSSGYDAVMETCENRLVGYVYLLDRDGRVRWRGCGFPEEEEVEWLMKATAEVIQEKK